MTFVSHAQNYEDVMLRRALRGVEHGFYVDVGAQDPVEDSVTKAFYERGWRGINIEPVTYWFQRLVSDRPHDINLQVAVSDAPGTLRLFEVVDSGLSTTDPEFAQRHAQAGHRIRESDVKSETLDGICETHRIEEIHFLKIDCEGGEAAALRGFSLERVRPWIILLEATEPNSQRPAYSEWEPMLQERRYHFVYADGLNRFYVADEHAELDGAFAQPPNVFDSFIRASEAVARELLDSASSDLSDLRDVQRLAQVESEREALRAKAEYLHGENERREAALVEHRRMLDEGARREAQHVERMQAEHERWRADVEAHRGELERRDGALAALRMEMEHSRAEGARLRSEVGSLHQEVARLHHEVASRDRQVAHLNEVIETIHRSHSWRITLPLRLVKRASYGLADTAIRMTYQLLRWPARVARPLLRLIARWSWLRSLAVRISGPDSRLTAHTRLFLFGATPAANGDDHGASAPSGNHLTRRAALVLEEIQARRQRPHGKKRAQSVGN